MDIEGIDVAVVYPSRGLFALTIPDMEPRLAAAMARAYNDWLYEFCQENPERLLGAGMISPFDVDDAVAETRRCVRELGFRGVFLRPNEVNGRNWHDPYYEPLWAALEELEVPLGFHEGGGLAAAAGRRAVRRQHDAEAHLCHPVEQMLRLAASARAASWSGIRGCAWPFSRATAAGCRSCSGAWTSTGSGWATSTPPSSRWRRASTSSGSASCRWSATRSR